MLELAIILWLLFVVLHTLINGRFFLWELVSLLPSFMFLFVPVVLLVFAVSSELEAGWLLPVLVSLGLGLPHLDINLIPAIKKPGSSQPAITLFNWNTQFWETTWEKKEDFISFLESQDADVYHLQEVIGMDRGTKGYHDAKAFFRGSFPGYHIIQSGEVVTLTRLEVISHQVIDRYILRVDARYQGQVVSLYNLKIRVHLLLFLLKTPKTFFSDMRRRFYQRHKEYQALHFSLKSNKKPLLMSGDFNTSKVQQPIKKLLHRYDDAFSRARIGIPVTYTFGGLLKLWRIDYVLGKKVNFLSYKTIDLNPYSDHDAIVVRFNLPNSSSN